MYTDADILTNENLIQVEKADFIPIPGSEPTKDDSSIVTNPEYHDKLLKYLVARLDSDKTSRLRRIQRFARTDQDISTWQKLSPEDSQRERLAENTGRSQGIPLNIPLVKSNLEDSTAFFSDIFAPFGGSFYGNPASKEQTAQVQLLAKKMNEDSKHSAYYAEVTQTMASLFKYNIGGFHVDWSEESEIDRAAGNRTMSLDLYNLMYDNSIQDVHKLSREGEWAAIAEVRSRFWLIRQSEKDEIVNLDKVFFGEGDTESTMTGTATYYRYPPGETNIEADGQDSKSSYGINSSEDPNFNWDSVGLGENTENMQIPGYEVIKMYCWLSKKQFDLTATDASSDSDLALYRFLIVGGKTIISMVRISPETVEIPIYLARMTRDELREASRSAAEHIKPFQAFISFLLNTHIAGVRSNIWGFLVYDPKVIDASSLRNGDVAGMLPLKQSGRDVRTAFQRIRGEVDTRQNLADAGLMMDFIKQFYPNQALPAQIAGMDRAVTSQVSTVVQGSTRKMFMFCRIIDADLMRPVRLAQYTNLINFDAEKDRLKGLKDDEVANLLNSGLGQMNKEQAAAHIKDLIFTLTQNPNAAQGIDMRGLYTAYSAMLTLGFDLGQFMDTPTLSNSAPTPPQAEGAAGVEIPQPGGIQG